MPSSSRTTPPAPRRSPPIIIPSTSGREDTPQHHEQHSIRLGSFVDRQRTVLATLTDAIITYTEDRSSGGGLLERIDMTSGTVSSIAYLEHGMSFVGPHAVVQDNRIAFTTDERIIHAFDLGTGKRLMKEALRADRLLRLVLVGDAICVTYVVDTTTGPRTRIAKLDLDANAVTPPELEIEGLASTVASHRLGASHDVIVVQAEASSRIGPFGSKLAIIWDRKREPLVIAGAHRTSLENGALLLRSDFGTRRISVIPEANGIGARLDVELFARTRTEPNHQWIAPSTPMIARLLPPVSGVLPVEDATFMRPKPSLRSNMDRSIGHTFVESIATLEEQHHFTASSLMRDVFALAHEEPALKWRLGSLGLTLRDPNGAAWVVPGADPSLLVFGELAGGDSGGSTASDTAHRLLAFYVYPARDTEQLAIVLIDPSSLEVTWLAKDFDAFFYAFLHKSEALLPTTVDTILELLGRDESVLVKASLDNTPIPHWFTRVYERPMTVPSVEDLLLAQSSHDLLLQERVLVLITQSDTRCNVQMIGRELRKVYEALDWTHHVAMVRRWPSVKPR